jgi:tetratricopeptide (TPR) repeat protein
MFDSGFDSDPIWSQRSTAANARARALDPLHPGALFIEGAAHLVAGRKAEAYRALVEAHRRLPNDPNVLHYLAYLFRLCDMIEAFEDAERHSISLDPSQPWSYWTMIRVAIERDRMDEARSWAEQTQQRFAAHPATSNRIWGIWLREGRAEDVLRAMDEAGEGVDKNASTVITRAEALAILGRGEEARRAILAIDSACRLDMDFAAYAGSVEAILGDADAAFRWLDRAVELGNDSAFFYENTFLFGRIHGDPRWPAFMAGVRARNAEAKRAFRWPVPA